MKLKSFLIFCVIPLTCLTSSYAYIPRFTPELSLESTVDQWKYKICIPTESEQEARDRCNSLCSQDGAKEGNVGKQGNCGKYFVCYCRVW